jgi:CRISPR-associated protein Cas1
VAVVYVKEQGAAIRKRGGRILVEKDGECLLEIPLRETAAIAVFGNVQVTTQALSELLERRIPLTFYTRHGRLKGHLTPEASRNVPLRLAQYRTALDEGAALEIGRAIVQAKLRNSEALVAEYRAHYPSPALAEAIDRLRQAAAQAGQAASNAALLGYEGAGAVAYFEAFAEMNRSGLPFEKREKHPPPDPINSLLSLGYTMVMNEIRSLAEGLGLEPYLGFLHRLDYGRPSLALDLLEPFRAPVADRLALRLVNERILAADDFAKRVAGPGAGGVVLQPPAFRRYLECYEAALSEPRRTAPEGMRAAMRQQTERLAAALRAGTPFTAYLAEEQTCST